jgi:hypothetical protein
MHFHRAQKTYEEIIEFKDTLSSDTFEDFENVKSIDTFVFRFIKIQDLIGDKLFKELLSLVGNYKDNMTMLDLLDKLEKIEIIENVDDWLEYRKLRNELTHEYPDNSAEIIEGIKNAMDAYVEIKQAFNRIKEYLFKKGLSHKNSVD